MSQIPHIFFHNGDHSILLEAASELATVYNCERGRKREREKGEREKERKKETKGKTWNVLPPESLLADFSYNC